MAKGRLGPAVIAQGNQASVTIQETDRMAMVAMTWQQRLSATTASKWTILVRLLVGLVVFFPEGIQKLAFPEILGAGRFANIGIPFPEITGPFVGIVETVSGALIIVGLFTRLAAIPLIIIMIVAILSTKVPILLGHEFWIFHLPKLPRYGFWSMMHEARADFTMLLGSIYLLIEGAGMWSIDSRLAAGTAGRSLT
jgi:putative oxidoreductase